MQQGPPPAIPKLGKRRGASVHRWENQTARRYYEVRVTRGLFGEWFVLQSWGGIGTRLGGERAELASDLAQASQQVEQIARRRVQRGYVLVNAARGVVP